jgi:uncharacterized membrane protein
MTQTDVSPNPNRRLRVALAVSVAVNLLVAGLAIGAAFHSGPDRDQMSRDLGFGPFSEALDMTQRRALRDTLMQKSPQIRGAMQQGRADLAQLLTALRAQPFDAAAMQNALETMRTRLQGQLTLGQNALAEVLIAMPNEQRLEFADRLERGQRRGGKDRPAGNVDGAPKP